MELTVGELNSQLDKLARSDAAGAGRGAAADAETRAKAGDLRIGILRHLLRVTTPRQMRWIVRLILREMKASRTWTLHNARGKNLRGLTDHVSGIQLRCWTAAAVCGLLRGGWTATLWRRQCGAHLHNQRV